MPAPKCPETASRPVLVVDDELAYVDAYTARLADTYRVGRASGGVEALGVMDEDAVDVVLLDRRMSDGSGDEVLTELRDRAPMSPAP